MRRSLLLVLVCCLPLWLCAGPLDDKGPPYFVDRYGPAKESRNLDQESFLHGGRGAIPLKGKFTLKSYRKDTLRVEAVFFLPSLTTAAVRLSMSHEWTDAQLNAALQAYGGDWKRVDRKISIKKWVSSDGTVAMLLLNRLWIQSPEIERQIAVWLANEESQRKAIPKF